MVFDPEDVGGCLRQVKVWAQDESGKGSEGVVLVMDCVRDEVWQSDV